MLLDKMITLRNITTIVWPEKEPHTVLSQKDGTVESMVEKI